MLLAAVVVVLEGLFYLLDVVLQVKRQPIQVGLEQLVGVHLLLNVLF